MNKVQKTGILLLVLVLALTACTSFADTGERGNTMNNGDTRQQTEFRYNRFADLYYYLLAHMPNCERTYRILNIRQKWQANWAFFRVFRPN